MGNLLLVRHATTEASASGRNLGQRSDPPLAREGRRLAARLGRALAAELTELEHDELRLVSSPALRCRQTSTAIARRLAVDPASVEVAEALVEIDYGEWEGLTAAECRIRDPALRTAWEADPYTERCPGGESGKDLAARIAGPFAEIEGWLAAGRRRVAIVVAHNHVNRVQLCTVFGWPMREYRVRLSQDPGGYNIIGLGTGRPIVRRLNAAPG